MKTDKEILDTNNHISTYIIERDIADTQCEIDDLRQRQKAYGELSEHGQFHEQKLYAFKRDAIPRQIEERSKFIKKLQHLLELRSPVETP